MISIDPVRRQLVAEMHLRPSPAVRSPASLLQFLILQTAAETSQMVNRLESGNAAVETDRFGRIPAHGMEFLWERHTEGCTFTVTSDSRDLDALEAKVLSFIQPIPGRVLRAIKIVVEDDPARLADIRRDWQLEAVDTVGGVVGDLRFWSNFRLEEEDGFGRLLVSPGATGQNETGRLIQQLQELGNYRNLALLSLPLARGYADELIDLENRTSTIINGLAAPTDDIEVLEALVALSADVAHLRDASSYRLSATRAYGQIACDRLSSLDAGCLDDLQSLGEFNNRRLLPALRTCENFTTRIDELALRIEQATGLLRARIETRQNIQNGELLLSLKETAHHQLRLQHLVEGLSVFAVGYYALGLIGYLFSAIPDDVFGSPKVLQGYLVIPVLLGIGLFLRRKKHAPSSR